MPNAVADSGVLKIFGAGIEAGCEEFKVSPECNLRRNKKPKTLFVNSWKYFRPTTQLSLVDSAVALVYNISTVAVRSVLAIKWPNSLNSSRGPSQIEDVS